MLTQSDGIISYMSPACTEVLGWAPEDLLGKQPWIIHPDDLAKVKELHYRALMGESGAALNTASGPRRELSSGSLIRGRRNSERAEFKRLSAL